MIAPPDPSATVRCCDKRVHLCTSHEADLAASVAFLWNGENALKVSAARWLMKRGKATKGSDSGQAQITGARAVAALTFDAVEEVTNQCGIDVWQIETGGWLVESLLGKLKQQTERVAIGSDGVGTCMPLLH